MIGPIEILIILAVILAMVAMAGGVVALVIWLNRRKDKTIVPPPKPPSMPATKRLCPQCGKEMAADAPLGLCPNCLMKIAMASEAGNPAAASVERKPALPAEEIERHFPQFEILSLLGQGGMGAVYKARQPALDRLVALKILPAHAAADAGFAERFNREARALAKLNHPNIVAVYEFGKVETASRPFPTEVSAKAAESGKTSAPLHYLVMEYVDGLNLRQLQQSGKLPPREALEIIPQICEALQFAHDEGVVHRDIKPENVLLDKRGRVKIADFGLARILGRESESFRLTGTKDYMGTPHYVAPEQIECPQAVDHRADIYSLGVVFYEMLTGELPLGKFQPPSKKVQVDVRLDEVVLHALEKEPDRRYQHASQVKTDVETIALTTGIGSSGNASTSSPHADSQSRVAPTTQGQESRLSRAAIWGAIWAPFGLLSVFLYFLLSIPAVPGGAPPMRLLVIALPLWLLGLIAPFGTTILGIIGITQIRHSRGRLYGLGLAVFDALLFPLLVVNGLLISGWSFAADELADGFIPHLGRTFFTILILGLIAASCVAASWWIIRAVWRVVNKPVVDERASVSATAGGTTPPRSGSGWKIAALIAAAMVLVLSVPVGSVLLAVYLPARSRQQQISAKVVVRVEEKLRQVIEKRLGEAGWRVEGLSVNVTPNLKEAECRFGTIWKNGLTQEPPPPTAIHLQPKGIGLWQSRGEGAFQSVRFSVDTTTEMATSRRNSGGTAPVVRFGPAQEVTLNDADKMHGNEALNFASGQLLSLPADFGQQTPMARQSWLDSNRVDLLVDFARDRWRLLSCGVRFRDLPNEAWGARNVELGGDWPDSVFLEKHEVNWEGRGGTTYLLPVDARLPLTFGFQASGGDQGVMQITAFADNPLGMKLRYKLAQGASSAYGAPPP